MTTVFNGAGEGSAKASWVLMRRTRADTFRSANRRKNLHRFSMLHVAEPKNRTCIGPHPRTPKKPTISVVERGYVRRSEGSAISRREMHIEHLHGVKLVEHGSRREARRQWFKPGA